VQRRIDRRAVLRGAAAVAVAGGLAGCTGPDDVTEEADGGGARGVLPLGGSLDADGATVTVESVTPHWALVVPGDDGEPTVLAREKHTYVVVAGGSDGTETASTTTPTETPASDDRFAVGFPVSRGQSSFSHQMRVFWTDGGTPWKVPRETTNWLVQEPEFVVERFAVDPASDGRANVSLSVRNDGEHDGAFLADLTTPAVPDGVVVRLPVPVRPSVREASTEFSVPLPADGGTVRLDWDRGDTERTV
jgi:hypothetical protein